MDNEYIFYFDESFHNRVINSNAIYENDYYNSYISVGIGVKRKDKTKGLTKLRNFEKKYVNRFNVEELKSSVVNSKKYRKGLASFYNIDVELYTDLFNILYKNGFIYYISSCDKVEYVLLQCKYYGSPLMNNMAVIYSINKAINTYKPQEVLNDLLTGNKLFFKDLKEFLKKQILMNKGISFKKKENTAFRQILYYLETINIDEIVYNFSYDFTYIGLEKLIKELNCTVINTKIIIDKEGSKKIIEAAKRNKFKNSIELDSKKCLGIRIADLFAGFFSRFMQGVYQSTYNDPNIPYKEKHYIPIEWFKINKKQFELYKTVSKFLKKYSEVYYSTYISIYADLFIETIGIVYYFDKFETYEEYIKESLENHYINCNNEIIIKIKEHLNIIENLY